MPGDPSKKVYYYPVDLRPGQTNILLPCGPWTWTHHPRTAEVWGMSTTTGRILISYFTIGRILLLQQRDRKLWKIADAILRIS